MSKLSSDANWTETSVANHDVFHPSLKSDVFGGTDTQVLSVSQTAALMGLSEREILDLVDEKVLCAKKDFTGKHWLIEKECALAQKKSHAGNVSWKEPVEEELDAEELDAEALSVEIGHEDEVATIELSGPDDFVGTAVNTEDDGTTKVVEVAAEDRLQAEPVSDSRSHQLQGKHVQELLDSLDFANVRLEGAMYRIGYLEAQVDSLQEQIAVLPEFRSRAAKAILIDRENDILKDKLSDHQAALEETNQILEHFARSKWYRFWAWALGVKLP